jgi:transposase
VLLRERRALGYSGGVSILKDHLATLKTVAQPEPLIRFETEPGRQMQADFATIRRGKDRLAVFIATLGWRRATFVEFVTDERMETCSDATSGRSTSSAASRARCSTTTCGRW